MTDEQLRLDAGEILAAANPIPPEFDRVCEIRGSKVMVRVAYSLRTRLLRVWFASGTTWEYEKVPAWKFANLIASPSIGANFNESIRDRYVARRISEVSDRVVPATKHHRHR